MMIYFLLVPGMEKPGTFCIEKINLIARWAKALAIIEQSQGLERSFENKLIFSRTAMFGFF